MAELYKDLGSLKGDIVVGGLKHSYIEVLL